MIGDKIQDALNKQIAREMFSSNIYLSMAAFYASINLNGFSHWMRMQAEEETEHALKIFDYLLARGGKPVISAIEAVPTTWSSPLDAFETAFKHEQNVTGWINEIANLAYDERDHATISLMKWFVDEQVEEEATTHEISEKLKLIGTNPGGLFMLDRELRMRAKAAH